MRCTQLGAAVGHVSYQAVENAPMKLSLATLLSFASDSEHCARPGVIHTQCVASTRTNPLSAIGNEWPMNSAPNREAPDIRFLTAG